MGPRVSALGISQGIHLHDKSREAVDPELRQPFVPIAALRAEARLFFIPNCWPSGLRLQDTVVGFERRRGCVPFSMDRSAFPGWFLKGEQNIRAVYYDGQASFTHSIGVIAGRERRTLPASVHCGVSALDARPLLSHDAWLEDAVRAQRRASG